jgi:hypothetical protein
MCGSLWHGLLCGYGIMVILVVVVRGNFFLFMLWLGAGGAYRCSLVKCSAGVGKNFFCCCFVTRLELGTRWVGWMQGVNSEVARLLGTE